MSTLSYMCYGAEYRVVISFYTFSATAPNDYATLSGMRSITSTSTRQCFDVMVVDDDEREHPEKLLMIGNPVSGGFQLIPAETEVWIIDGSKSV